MENTSLEESLKKFGICTAILKAQPANNDEPMQTQNVEIRKPIEVFLEICNRNDKMYIFDDDNKPTIRRLYEYFVCHSGELDKNKGILLIGQPGTGKTRLMKCFQELCRKYRVLKPFGVLPVTMLQNNVIMSDRKDYNYFSQTYYSGSSTDLCIDDIGTETKLLNYFGNESYWFETFLFERTNVLENYGIKLHATTNLNLDEISEFYSARTADRFNRLFNIVYLTGESRS